MPLSFFSEVSPWNVKRKIIIIISCFCWAKQTDHKVNLDFQEKCALHHLLKIFIKLECCLFSYSSHKCSLNIKFDKLLTQLNNYDKIAFLCVPSALIIYCYHLWQFISLDLLWPRSSTTILTYTGGTQIEESLQKSTPQSLFETLRFLLAMPIFFRRQSKVNWLIDPCKFAHSFFPCCFKAGHQSQALYMWKCFSTEIALLPVSSLKY